MVSFWPFKGDDTSPASFEKSLSSISGKISKVSTSLDSSRQQGRRFKALWTLYSSFAYILYLMIIGLVVGLRNCGIYEYTGLAAGPVVIYTIRLTLTTYYTYRQSRLQTQLSSLQSQRDTIIARLKAATKYDSTQQLLEKYGGTPARPKQKSSQPQRQPAPNKQAARNTGGPARTPSFIPPPTANIPRGPPVSAPNSPHRSTPQTPGPAPPFTAAAAPAPWTHENDSGPLSPDDSASFAPNAFPSQPPPSSSYAYSDSSGGKWYDRLLDVLLGEDETNPKNRLALICSKCRLVNGQAPPGLRRVEDVGRWRCGGCGSMNGVDREDEGRRLVRVIKEEKERKDDRGEEDGGVVVGSPEKREEGEGDESDVTQYSDDEDLSGEKEKVESVPVKPEVEVEPESADEGLTKKAKGKGRRKKA